MNNRTEAALELWESMSPMQRYEMVLSKLPDERSMTKRFRMAIAYIAANLVRA